MYCLTFGDLREITCLDTFHNSGSDIGDFSAAFIVLLSIQVILALEEVGNRSWFFSSSARSEYITVSYPFAGAMTFFNARYLKKDRK
jgi:hypothetical protein